MKGDVSKAGKLVKMQVTHCLLSSGTYNILNDHLWREIKENVNAPVGRKEKGYISFHTVIIVTCQRCIIIRTIIRSVMFHTIIIKLYILYIRESVDSLCRDGADARIT